MNDQSQEAIFDANEVVFDADEVTLYLARACSMFVYDDAPRSRRRRFTDWLLRRPRGVWLSTDPDRLAGSDRFSVTWEPDGVVRADLPEKPRPWEGER